MHVAPGLDAAHRAGTSDDDMAIVAGHGRGERDAHERGAAAFRTGEGNGERRLAGIADGDEVGREIGDGTPAEIALDDEQLVLRRRVAQEVGLAGTLTKQQGQGCSSPFLRRQFV